MYKISANTLLLGKNVIFVPECHSTNSLLIELAQKTLQPEGTVVITNAQTKGRGQRGNGWEAEHGKNLTFSLLLKPHFLAAHAQFYLNIAVSLALTDFLSVYLPTQPLIKWPNDILVRSKKLSGILIENILSGEKIHQSIIGIGLNVNQQNFSFTSATSIQLETNTEYDLVALLNELLVSLERRYVQLQNGNIDELRLDYLNHLFWIHQEKPFVSNGQSFNGTIEDIDQYGKLAVRHQGQLMYYGLKEISFVNNA